MSILLRKIGSARTLWRHRREFHQFLKETRALTVASGLDGSVQDDQEQLLEELVRAANNLEGPIIEIGTLFGLTTVKMCLWKTAKKDMVTIDDYSWNPWGLTSEAHFDLTKRILRYHTERSHVRQIRMGKNEFYSTYIGERPSMVFFDADHTYEETSRDIGWAQDLGVPIIAGHDYTDRWPGVVRAVRDTGRGVKLCGTLWVLQ